jgi:hypothetical protein
MEQRAMTVDHLAEVQKQLTHRRKSLVRLYSNLLLNFPGLKSLAKLCHRVLNDLQYDPLNPKHRTTDNPEGLVDPQDAKVNAAILADKTLIDKFESYLKLRPFSNGIMYFFVISGGMAGFQHNNQKLLWAAAVFFLALPILLSRQSDFE